MSTDVVIGRNVHHKMWEQHIPHRAVYGAMGITRFTLAKKLRGDIGWSAHDVLVAATVLGVELTALYEGTAPVLVDEGRAVAGTGFEPATSGSRVGGVFEPRKHHVRPASRAGNGEKSTACGKQQSTTTRHTSKHRDAAGKRSAPASRTCAAGPGSARILTRLHV